MFSFGEFGGKGTEAMDTVIKSCADVAKNVQAITIEATDYSKKSFQGVASHVEALSGVRSVEAAIELQTDFARSAYEDFVAEASKIGGLYADLAKSVYRPFEGPFSKSTSTL
jgi:hypothetical protein